MTGTIAGFTSTGIDDNATSTAITIDASENVGIGTTSPESTLEVSTTSGIILRDNNSAGGGGMNIFYTTITGYLNWFAGMNAANVFNIGTAGTDDTPIGNAKVNKITVANNGNLTVEEGNLVIGTSGKGIDFSAVSDGSRSVSSNLLDDYEEGTWTPGFGTVTGWSSASVLELSGTYTKVGNLVTIECSFYLQGNTNAVTANSRVDINGIPFTASTQSEASFGGAGVFNYNNANNASLSVSFATTTLIRTICRNDINGTPYNDGGRFQISATYRV